MRWIAAPTALAIALLTPVVFAFPLQDVVARSKSSVAHLSIRDSSNEERSSGSGFVISADGKLATNFHVIDDADRIVAVFSNGTEVEVTGVRLFDPETDVAVLQLAAGTYPPLHLSGAPAKQGDEIAVIGSPLGLGEAVSTGIVAAFREHGTAKPGRSEGKESWGLQITAPIAPGSSGSPILNDRAEVVGLVVGGVYAEPVHFGIAVARLKQLLETGPGELKPLSEARAGLSVRTNMLISAAFLGTLIVGGWGIAFVVRRRNRRREPIASSNDRDDDDSN